MASFALTLLLGASLTAGQANSDSIKQKEIREFTVYSSASQQIALPYVKVDKSVIDKNNFATAADALSSETGISLVRDGSWATSLNVRGIPEQRLLLLSNGDRMLTATDIAGAMSTVDLNNLEKIEVIKGAASVLYGTGAMGGIINFISDRPGYASFFSTSGKISSGYSTVNQLWNSAANINLKDSNWYLGVHGSYRTAGNTNTPKGEITNSQFHDAAFGVNGGLTYGDNQELLVSYDHSEAWDVGLPGSNVFPKTSVVRYKDFKRNQMNGEYIFKDLSYNLTELRFKAYMQNIERNVENIVSSTPVSKNLVLPSSRNNTYGAKVTAQLYFNDYNTITVGADGWQRSAETARLKVMQATDTTVIGEQPTPNATMFNAGIFALYKHTIDPKYLRMNFGLRGDYIRTHNDTAYNQIFKYQIADGKQTNMPFTRNILFLPRTHQQISYSAHIDVDYTPFKGNKFGLSVANSYRVPSIEERFKYIDQAGTIRVGNPDLKPEKGFFGNLSYSYSNKKLLLKADVFANYMIDLITEQQGTFKFPGGSAVNALVNVNIDEALYTGAEAEVQWLVLKNLWIDANASYVKAKNAKTGDFLPLVPPAHGLASVNYRVSKTFETALSAVWAVKQIEAASGENETAGYVVYNFNAHSMPLNFKNTYIQLFAGIDNILDKAYKNHLYNNRGLDLYEPGRNFFAKVKWMW
jgi:hemoglobin/transferrin/lactoferrin receptor protein